MKLNWQKSETHGLEPDPSPREIRYTLFSTDDHLVEPPHMFEGRLPSKLQAAAPRVVETEEGHEVWEFDGRVFFQVGLNAVVGRKREDWKVEPTRFDEMRPGCYDPKARIDDMEMNWVESSLCFPTFPRFCGQTCLEAKDREVAEACVYAYNDWMVDEWCGEANGRMIPLCLIPLWDPELAAAEVRRNAARGVRAVAFSEIPPKLGLPSIHSGEWDPLFRACAETGTVVCMHIGSSSTMPS